MAGVFAQQSLSAEHKKPRPLKSTMARTLRAEPSTLLIAIRFCPGASRQSIKRMQRAAVPASKLVCTSAADPQRRSTYDGAATRWVELLLKLSK